MSFLIKVVQVILFEEWTSEYQYMEEQFDGLPKFVIKEKCLKKMNKFIVRIGDCSALWLQRMMSA